MNTRTWKLGTLLALAVFIPVTTATAADEPPVPPPAGETITVTGFADTAAPDTLNCMPSADPAFDIECPTLREAVMYANSSAEPSLDTIMLSKGTYTLTTTGADEIFAGCEDGANAAPVVTNEPDASVGDLDITDSLIIQGAGPDVTVVEWAAWDADPDPTLTERVFHVYSTTDNVFAEFHGMRVRNGLLLRQFLCIGPPSEFPPDPPEEPLPTQWLGMRAGAGIAIGAAANAVLYDPNRSGVENSAGRGGSKRPDDEESGFTYFGTVNEMVLDANLSDGDGGGLYNAGPLTGYRLGIIGNMSGTNGGGIYNEGVTTIDTAVIADNMAEGGGGVFLTGRPDAVGPDADLPVTILNTTLSGNMAIGGGAISGRVVTVNITNSTVSGNIAEDVGGGVYTNGVVRILFSTIADNRSIGAEAFGGGGVNVFYSELASVTLMNTLLSNNTAGSGVDEPIRDANCGCSGNLPDCVNDVGDGRLIQTLGYNLSDDMECNLDAVGDQPEGIDAMIGPLADNGGLTETHALLKGSPAIDNGIAVEGVTTDQRGKKRDRKPDIGAFEKQKNGGGGGGGGGCSLQIADTGKPDPFLLLLGLVALASLGVRRRRARLLTG
jgi:hypothetical protein